MFTLNNGAGAVFRIAGKDDTEQYRAITGVISTSNPAVAYIAKVPSGQPDQFCIKSRPGSVAAGAMVPFVVTVNAIDDRGTALPPQVYNFQVQGPPLPPPATHVVMYEGPFDVDSSYVIADPGTGTINL